MRDGWSSAQQAPQTPPVRRTQAVRPARRSAPSARWATLVIIAGVWLALLILGVAAQAHVAAQAAPPVSAIRSAGKLTPTIGLTTTPVLTPSPTSTFTATPTGSVTPATTVTATPTDTPTVYINSGTAGPQPTKLVLSQPTVGAGGGGFGGGVANLGDSSLFIAVVLGCVTSVLGIVIGGVALLALIRNGYGPFLRALLPGQRRRRAAAATSDGDQRTPVGASGSRGGWRGYDAAQSGRRVGDGTLNYQETGEARGRSSGSSAGRQPGRDPRDPGNARVARGDPRDDGWPTGHRGASRGDPRGAGRQPPRSGPRAGASRAGSRTGARSRDGW